MTVNFVKKLKFLSPQLLLLHFWAKLILGIGIGLIAANYLSGNYGWWIIGLGLGMSLPCVCLTLKKQQKTS